MSNRYLAGTAMLMLLCLPQALRAAEMQMEVTLNLGISGMQSFASYRYYADQWGASPQRYEQYHVIVNGDAEESSAVFTDFWSNNLSSHVTPAPPICYNARMTITVHSGPFSCCTTEASYYKEAGAQCLQGPPAPPRDDETLVCTENECPDHSPLVIDIRSGRYAFSDAANGAMFDIDADGTLDRVAWPVDDSVGFLFVDRNGNGTPDDGSELLGNYTRLANGELAANGFQALRELDANGDGVVNSDDSTWTTLRLWRDGDRDGSASAGEIADLTLSGVAVLGLDYKRSGRRDQYGNTLRWKGMVRLTTGETPYYDVYLTTER